MDDEAEARFQAFINGPSSPNTRLRDAFAQLMAYGGGQAMPMENVWRGQGMNQLPPTPGLNLTRPREMGDSMTTDTPMRQIVPPLERNFPQAAPGPNAPNAVRPAEKFIPEIETFPTARSVEILPREQFRLPPGVGKKKAPKPQPEAPFHGKGKVAGPYKKGEE